MKKIHAMYNNILFTVVATKPGRRSTFVYGEMRSYDFPGLVFVQTTIKDDHDRLFVYGFRPETKQIKMDDLCLFSVRSPHVFSSGCVCIGDHATTALTRGHIDPVQAFFGSNNEEEVKSTYYCRLESSPPRSLGDILLDLGIFFDREHVFSFSKLKYDPPGVIEL